MKDHFLQIGQMMRFEPIQNLSTKASNSRCLGITKSDKLIVV